MKLKTTTTRKGSPARRYVRFYVEGKHVMYMTALKFVFGVLGTKAQYGVYYSEKRNITFFEVPHG